MDNSSDLTIKIEKDNLEHSSNEHFEHLLFYVDVKVENEREEQDWCISDCEGPGDLLEPLFFKEVPETLMHQCERCPRYFSDWYSLLKHNLTHLRVSITKQKTFQCSQCSALFTSHLELQLHTRNSTCVCDINRPQNTGRTYFLAYKPKACRPIRNLEETSKHGESYVPKIKESANSNIRNSLLLNKSKDKIKYMLEGVKDITNADIKTETKGSFPKSKMPHKCDICDKTYTYTHWHAHMQEVHGEGGFVCGLCDVEFKCERYFKRHMKNVHYGSTMGAKRPAKNCVNCDECDAVLQGKHALKTHKRTVHSTEKYICTICKSELKCKSYLLTHMKRVHYNDGKQHACECGKKFKSPRYLKVHKKNAHSR